jgi:hypothetical protein
MTAITKNDDTGKPVKINRLLETVFEDRQWRNRVELHRVFEFWNETVGREIGAVAQPSLIRGRVLWVKVKDSIWMQHLHLQKITLLEKLNLRFTGEKLSDIHFQLDSALSPPPEPETDENRPLLLDKKQEKEFDNLISSLENPDLRASLKHLWVTMKKKGK